MPGPKMRIVFVSAVLLVAVSSVLSGLDWTSAPMQPMPETKNLVFVAPPPPPKCDVNACERAYRSFTESDCTYQPLDGSRRLCEK